MSSAVSVVILYTHPLLGEGLAHLLAVEPELDVVAISTGDLARAEGALARSPDVVIVEHSQPSQAIELLKLAPDALLIELGLGADPTFTYRREEISGQPEAIVRAIEGLRGGRLRALEAAAAT